MAEDDLSVLLNIELADDCARGGGDDRAKRRPLEQITLGMLALFLEVAGAEGQTALARRYEELAAFWEHFQIS